MDYEIIRKSSLKVANWSGGTTTELIIYPNNADFKKGDFDVRCSIATVNDENSVFTSLKDVSRTLMVLKGTLKLQHQDHHEVVLNPYEQDSFSGDWHTESYGKVTDFNLMTKNNKSSELTYRIVNQLLEVNGDFELHFIHIINGQLNIDGTKIESGDSIYFPSGTSGVLTSTNSNTEIIQVIIAR